MAGSNPFKNECDPFADRRVYPRVPVALPAFLQASGQRHSVQILDLSAGGAKLSCSAIVPPETAVMLDCGMLARPAVVRWQDGQRLGLSFDSQLGRRELEALAGRSKALEALMKTRD